MIIKLKNKKEVIIDDSDWDLVKKFSWHYSCGAVAHSDKNRSTLLMHRLIMNTPKGLYTDHINGNRLDNRRCNLRICTNAENMRNMRKKKTHTSKYKGVSWYKRDKCWRAYIVLGNKQFHLGYFSNEKEAGKSYNLKAIELYGDFAYLNDI